MPLLVYTPTLNPRKIYVFNHMLVNILGVNYTFTHNQQVFLDFKGAKFNYSGLPCGDELHIEQHPFINENTINQQHFNFAILDDYQVPFAVKTGFFSFDIFSAAFFLLSRYEEYLPSQKDNHGRYQAENSLAFTQNFLHKPVIDIWAYYLLAQLKLQFPDLKSATRKFTFTPTIDIDNPYYLKTETAKNKTIKIIKALLKGNFSMLKHDPFDTYQYLKNLHQHYNLQPIFFFLVANKHNYDSAPNLNDYQSVYKKLIQSIATYAQLGIHPSYQSNQNVAILTAEIGVLKSALSDKKIELSRQHFLKLDFPETYNNLILQNIKHDYTMGYASRTGFRASTCTPFYWYNLQTESVTDLKIHPFAVMDQTLKKYLGLNKTEAIANTQNLISEIKKVNGNFISLWHNETLSNFGTWKGWHTVYQQMLANATNKN